MKAERGRKINPFLLTDGIDVVIDALERMVGTVILIVDQRKDDDFWDRFQGQHRLAVRLSDETNSSPIALPYGASGRS